MHLIPATGSWNMARMVFGTPLFAVQALQREEEREVACSSGGCPVPEPRSVSISGDNMVITISATHLGGSKAWEYDGANKMGPLCGLSVLCRKKDVV